MPRNVEANEDKPRRKRGAAAIALEEASEPGFVKRLLLRSPKDVVAGALAFTAVSAVVANALFMQAGRHPSPLFGASTVTILPAAEPAVANPLPRPRPVAADAKAADVRPADAVKPAETAKAADTKTPEPKQPDAIAPAVKAIGAPHAAAVARPPAAIPVSSRSDPLGDLITSSRRVASVQRVLTEYGYGQLKPTGTVGSDTQAAIQKFERERKLPVTGQVSDRLVRELAASTGRQID